MSDTLACPSCHGPMTSKAYPRAMGGEETLDICWTCQGIWFDAYESTQLAPAGVVALFREIHENKAGAQPLASALRCPRCTGPLMYRQDIARTGRFAYHLCPSQHGRFTPFNQFLIEKGFIRALSNAELAALSAKIQTVRCSGCGAPVDLQRDTACGFCHAPIVVLDTEAVEKALASYSAAGKPRTIAPHDVVAEVIMQQERDRQAQLREGKTAERGGADLISASIDALFRFLV